MKQFYELTDKETEIVIDALENTYLFDGPEQCPDYNAAHGIVVKLRDDAPIWQPDGPASGLVVDLNAEAQTEMAITHHTEMGPDFDHGFNDFNDDF